jgi:PAS domain S-box-containing protein
MPEPLTTDPMMLHWQRALIERTLNASGGLGLLLNVQGQILQINAACEQLTGYSLAKLQGGYLWEVLIAAEQQATVKALFHRLKNGYLPSPTQTQLQTRSGQRRLIVWSHTPLFDPQGTVTHIVSQGSDITQRHRSETALRQQLKYEQLLSTTAQRIYHSQSLQDTLNTAVIEVRQLLQADRTLILRFKPNWLGIVLVESLASTQWPATLGLQIRDPNLQHRFIQQYQQGQGSAIRDLSQVKEADCPLSLLAYFQARAALITPILQGNQLWGLLIVNQCDQPRDWSTFEVHLLDQLVTQLAIAIQQSELYDQLQRELNERTRVEQVLQVAKDDLELRVIERTARLTQINDQLQRELKERQQTEAALARLSHQHELILNSMGEGLFGLNRHAEITFVNQAASQILGYAVDALVGYSVRLLIAEQSQTTALLPIDASLLDGGIHQASDILFRRKDGSILPVEYMSTPIWEQSKIVGAVVTFKDISHRQLVEQMKDEFISVVSHELRTPLTSIHGSLRMLASGLLDHQPQKRQRLIEIAASSTERLVRLVNDILDVERIEAGKLRMAREACNLEALIQQAVNTMQNLADRARISVQTNFQASAVCIWADPDRILQTLTNLLSNAIKFSEPGGTVQITVTSASMVDGCSTVTDQVQIAVRDQGRGIPPEKLETIFERFQQADSSDARNCEGTGLGLAICRSIVQQHGGRIWAESQINQGSSFFFTIPLYLQSA